jgi:DNA-binding CsgD family transcriptional regulator
VFVIARDPTGYGVALSAVLRRKTRFARGRIERWARAAAHLSAAYRLRRHFERAGVDDADAIFSPRGRLEHASDALDTHARTRVREGVKKVLDAWALERHSPDDALANWRALEFGRWSILDTFDTDGKRYVAARRNDPAVDGLGLLTHRERQVAAFAALGHALKLIAYELGLSEPTVSYHLARASQKLGVRTRAELVAAIGRRPKDERPSQRPSR